MLNWKNRELHLYSSLMKVEPHICIESIVVKHGSQIISLGGQMVWKHNFPRTILLSIYLQYNRSQYLKSSTSVHHYCSNQLPLQMVLEIDHPLKCIYWGVWGVGVIDCPHKQAQFSAALGFTKPKNVISMCNRSNELPLKIEPFLRAVRNSKSF